MKSTAPAAGERIRAYLLHLGYNMWSDRASTEMGLTHYGAQPFLRVDRDFWEEILDRVRDAGMNMVVIDLGEGVRYRTHPELAVRGSWTPARLRRELSRIRKRGLEPIPKLNFSTAHDAWLGSYARCVSTRPYYAVCRDLIREVIDLFDQPRFFHLGMDEEEASHQRLYDYAVMRQHDLWWHDLEFLVRQVRERGSRPWVWSDYAWNHPETFYARMPAYVVQSNWYYGKSFSRKMIPVQTYVDLETHGYDQIPAGSNWTCPENFGRTIRFARKHVTGKHLLGFLQTVWRPTLTECRDRHVEAIRLAGEALGRFA